MDRSRCCLCWNQFETTDSTSNFYTSKCNVITCRKYLRERVTYRSNICDQGESLPVCSLCYARSNELLHLHFQLEEIQRQLKDLVVAFSDEILNFKSYRHVEDNELVIKKEQIMPVSFNIPEIGDNNGNPNLEVPVEVENSSNWNDDSSVGRELIESDPFNVSSEDDTDLRVNKPPTTQTAVTFRELRIQLGRLPSSDVAHLFKLPATEKEKDGSSLKRPVRKAATSARLFTSDIYNDEEISNGNEKDALEKEISGSDTEYVSTHEEEFESDEDDSTAKTIIGSNKNPKADLMIPPVSYFGWKIGQLQCKYCFKALESPQLLFDHYKSHFVKNSESLIECLDCNERFTSKSALYEHIYKNHKNRRPFLCQCCGTGFKTKSNVNRHMANVHEMKNKGDIPKAEQTPVLEFQCKECGESFPLLGKLKHHMKKHQRRAREKGITHLCSICGKGFAKKLLLHMHMKGHNPDLPFPCSTCDARFSIINECRRHEITHSSEKPFKCSQCVKCFSTKTYLKTHMITHSTERPFGCDNCGQTFKRKRCLIEHNHKQGDCREGVRELAPDIGKGIPNASKINTDVSATAIN